MLQLLDFFNAEHSTHLENYIVSETQEGWQIEVDMPGVKKENIAVNVSGNLIEIKGERERAGRKITYTERFKLPQTIQSTDGITATAEFGVLSVQVPKKLIATALQAIPIN